MLFCVLLEEGITYSSLTVYFVNVMILIFYRLLNLFVGSGWSTKDKPANEKRTVRSELKEKKNRPTRSELNLCKNRQMQ